MANLRSELQARINLRDARISATRELSEKRAEKLYAAIQANERELEMLIAQDPEGDKATQIMHYYDELTTYYYQSDTYDIYILKNHVIPGLNQLHEDVVNDPLFTDDEIAPLIKLITRTGERIQQRLGLVNRAFARVKRLAGNDVVQSMVAGAATRSPLLGLALLAYKQRPDRNTKQIEQAQSLDRQRLQRTSATTSAPTLPSAPELEPPAHTPTPVEPDDDVFDDDDDDDDVEDVPTARKVSPTSGGMGDGKAVLEMVEILNRHTTILESIYNINRAQHTAGLKRLKADELAAEERAFEARERGNPRTFASPYTVEKEESSSSLVDSLMKSSGFLTESLSTAIGTGLGLKGLPKILGALKGLKSGGRGFLLTGIAAATVAAALYKMMGGDTSGSADTIVKPGPIQENLGHVGTALAAGEMFQKARGLFPVAQGIKAAIAGGEGISTALKLGAKAGKRLPMAGLGFGAVAGAMRATEGDYTGAGLELASGALGPLGLPIDAYLMARDLGYVEGPTTVSRVPQNAPLLNTIAKGEVGTTDSSGYNTTLGHGAYRPGGWKAEREQPITKMTLREIYKLQSEMIRNPQNRFNSSAVGRYQIVRTTLFGSSGTADRPAAGSLMSIAGLSASDQFTPAVQDMLANLLLERRGLKDVQSGKITSQKFQENLAKEWASIATPTTGTSYYNQPTATSTPAIQQAILASISTDSMSRGRASVTQTLATPINAPAPVVMTIATNQTNVNAPTSVGGASRGPIPSPTDSQPTVRGVLNR